MPELTARERAVGIHAAAAQQFTGHAPQVDSAVLGVFVPRGLLLRGSSGNGNNGALPSANPSAPGNCQGSKSGDWKTSQPCVRRSGNLTVLECLITAT